jgi:hypothetical protein
MDGATAVPQAAEGGVPRAAFIKKTVGADSLQCLYRRATSSAACLNALAHHRMSAVPHDPAAKELLMSHLQHRDMAALRCRGPCFIEMDAVHSVDVAVTAFHLIFCVSHQGAHSSRLSWSDVSNIHSSISTHGRRCAIIEFFTHEPKSLLDVAASKPASPSQKLTKVAQMIYEETIAKAADATSRALKQIFAQTSVVHHISEEPLVAKPTMLYIEDVRSHDDDRSVVIASQRAFLYFLFHKQTRPSLLSAKSFIHDDPELLKQYVALEHEVTAATSIEQLLPLLQDLQDGASCHHSIKHAFLHRPLLLDRLTRELSALRPRAALATPGAPTGTLLSPLSSALNIRFATAVLRCVSAIASDAYSLVDKQAASATSAAQHCLLAAVAPVISEVELSDSSVRVSLSSLLQAQVEAVFHCLFLCFGFPNAAPVLSFLSANLTSHQLKGFISSAMYAVAFSSSFSRVRKSHSVCPSSCLSATPYCAWSRFCATPKTRVQVLLMQAVTVSLFTMFLQQHLLQRHRASALVMSIHLMFCE